MTGLRKAEGGQLRGGGRLKRLLGRVTVPIGVMLAVSQLAAPAAQAVAVSTTGSYPGTATMPLVTLDAGAITSHARTIYENPTYRARDQWVCVNHRLWYHSDAIAVEFGVDTGQWKLRATSGPQCGYIRAAQTAITDGGYSFALGLLDRGEELSVDVVITWQLSNGALLGQKIYDYNRLSDYACNVTCGYGYIDGMAYLSP